MGIGTGGAATATAEGSYEHEVLYHTDERNNISVVRIAVCLPEKRLRPASRQGA